MTPERFASICASRASAASTARAARPTRWCAEDRAHAARCTKTGGSTSSARFATGTSRSSRCTTRTSPARAARAADRRHDAAARAAMRAWITSARRSTPTNHLGNLETARRYFERTIRRARRRSAARARGAAERDARREASALVQPRARRRRVRAIDAQTLASDLARVRRGRAAEGAEARARRRALT
jgi:hypothetical protein